jgi:hypothetical protein
MKTIKKSIVLDADLYEKVKNEVKNDFRSNFNREIQFILTAYFENKERENTGVTDD